ncbi:enoyl-CoA hydratase/isomerase family protein [Chloroflexi bacterium TSY]|nr:enoyl-CoA hydratase/isomerase family protein [Chloroflexi bacterium TSY]
MPNFQTLFFSIDQNVALIKLNRPERRNALTRELLTELKSAIDLSTNDRTVRAVLLTGEGKGFCAGQDLSVSSDTRSADDVRNSLMNYYKPAIMGICTIDKPVIGAINGAAAGAGAALALACDLRIMAEDAFIMLAFSNIGLVPDAGSSWFLARHIGYSRAYQIAIEAERVTAARCLELGLANRVVAPESLLDEGLVWAQALAQRPTYALGLTKQVMMGAITSTLEDAISSEANKQGLAIQTHDHQEGLQAFKEKRKPIFQGQ